MQHTRTITLTSPAFTAADVLKCLQEEMETLRSLLNEYPYFAERTGVVKDVRIDEQTVQVGDEVKGSFEVYYRIQFYFACEYEYKEHPQKMKVGFQLRENATKLHLIGEYLPERDGEEF